jgi:hypothetical protein
LFKSIQGRLEGEIARCFIFGGYMARSDTGMGPDPFITGIYGTGEIIIGNPICRNVVSGCYYLKGHIKKLLAQNFAFSGATLYDQRLSEMVAR